MLLPASVSQSETFKPSLPEGPTALPQEVNLFTTTDAQGNTRSVFKEKLDPSLYAFVCPEFNRVNKWAAVKVGDTMRTVPERMTEWRAMGKLYEDLEVVGSMPACFMTPAGKKVYVRDYNFHKFLEKKGYKRVVDLPRESYQTLETEHVSHEFFLDGEDATRPLPLALLKEALEDQALNYGRPGSGYQYYDEVRGQKFLAHYPPAASFPLRAFQEEVVEAITAYLTTGHPLAEYLLSAPTRSGKSFMAAQAALRIFERLKTVKPHHLAVVVSGMAQVEDEWRMTFEGHQAFNQLEDAWGLPPEDHKCGTSPCTCPTKFRYLSRRDLEVDSQAVTGAWQAGAENVVVFLTLQDLSGSVDGRKGKHFTAHDFLKTQEVDLLIVDEAHFASFTEGGSYQGAIMGQEEQLKAADASHLSDAEEVVLTQEVTALTPTLGRLFVTATPFNILAGTNRFEQGVNASIITEGQIWQEKIAWEEAHAEDLARGLVKPWDNPCFGLVERKSFAVDLGIPPNELFMPTTVHPTSSRPRFRNEALAREVIRGMFGQGPGAPNIFLQEDYLKAGLGKHVYISLPLCASCDAFEDLLREVLKEAGLAEAYEILNISSAYAQAPFTKMDVVGIKAHIEASEKKTITLTVDKMGTGVTVEKWDTVVLARSLASAQKFVQTAGRAGTPWVSTQASWEGKDATLCRKCQQAVLRAPKTYLCEACAQEEGPQGDKAYADSVLKVVEKPSCAVIGFDSEQLLSVRYREALTSVATGKTSVTGEEATKALEEALAVSEVFVYDPARVSMVQVTASNILDNVFKAMGTRGTSELAATIPMDVSKLTPDLAAQVTALTLQASGGSFREDFKAFQEASESSTCLAPGCARAVRQGKSLPGVPPKLCEDHYTAEAARLEALAAARKKPAGDASPGSVPPEASAEALEAVRTLEEKIRAVYATTLLFALLCPTPLEGVASLMALVEEAQGETPQGRPAVLATHLGLPLALLRQLRLAGVTDSLGLDTAVAMVGRNFAREVARPWDRFSLAVNSLGRFSPNELPTPEEVAKMVVAKASLTEEDWKKFAKEGFMLDGASRSGIMAVAFFEEGLRQGLSPEDFKGRLYAVATSPATYELSRRVFEVHGWDPKQVFFVEGLGPLETGEVVRLSLDELAACTAPGMTCPYHHGVSSPVVGVKVTGSPEARRTAVLEHLRNKALDPLAVEALREQVKQVGRFTHYLSNPPYRGALGGVGMVTTGGTVNIFQHFVALGLALAPVSAFIMPGGRWLQRSANCEPLSDAFFPWMKSVDWYPHAQERGDANFFPGVILSDGVTVASFTHTPEETFVLNGQVLPRPGAKEILPLTTQGARLVKTLKPFLGKTLQEGKYSGMVFGLRSYFVERNPQAVVPVTVTEGSPLKPPFASTVKAWLGDATPGPAKRVQEYYLDASQVQWTPLRETLYKKWKVVGPAGRTGVSPATASYSVVDDEHITGESWVILRALASEKEALNFKAYLDASLVRGLLAESRGGKLSKWGIFVPDLEDYSSKNPLFTSEEELPKDHPYRGKSLEARLASYFKLQEAEEAEATELV